ncbi:hypothetical protein CAPTEDRAFT_218143 [Capitella teleta]|uniref:Fibronectin type-III domain-containing protein n=1 Tax=Capitella teleta TaxID=283909 RepID=R7V3R6_CAPTE|nr:hypothetical protein CAPTEDRAFT_218143 [Capitella teleta]|eukprot:ELU13112.1 hypothetical protein CAPTEDRAFT_218143 [Capitella teleta]
MVDSYTVKYRVVNCFVIIRDSVPDRPASLLKESSTNDSITVTWIPPKSTKYDGYRIAISPPNQKTEVLARSVISHTFRDLMSSQRYTITLTTVLNDVESKQLSSDFYTNPDAPTNVRILSRTDTRITFIWSPPANPGEIDDYQCYLQDSKGHEITSFDNYGSDIREHSFDIYAGRTYIISVYAYAYYKLKGMPASLRFSIIPAVPHNVRVTARGQSYLECEFFGQSNSYYDGFEITWLEKASSAKPSNAFLQREDVSYVITDLKSSTTYDIMVYATSGEQKSRGVALETSTKASSEAELFVKSYDQQSITVAWKKPSGKTVDGLKLNIDPVPNAQMGSEEVATDIQEHTWEGLEAGHEYTLEIEVIYADATSEKVNRKQTTQPKPVLNLKAGIYPRGLILSWDSGFYSFENAYRYQYVGRITKLNNVPWEITTSKRVKLEHLFPGEMYEFYVEAIANGKHSPNNRSVMATAPPLPPLGLTIDIAETTESSVLMFWEDDETRSYITSWDVEIADIGTYRPKAVGSTSDRTVLDYEITNLISGKNYTAYVFGKSGDQRSYQAATVDLTLSEFRALKF